jgi:hypothetical protein
MEYLFVIVALLVPLVLGFYIGNRATRSSVKQGMLGFVRGRAEDRHAYLSTLSRELANYMIWHDPDRYHRLYVSLLKEATLLAELSKENMQKRYDEIAARYPQYRDFDVIGTRPYVLYPDGLSWKTIEDIEQAYRDIVHFQLILIASDENWKHFICISGEEEQHLAEYVQRVKDTKLRIDIEQAMTEFRAWNKSNSYTPYESQRYTVQKISHFAENRYGIFVKPSHEYAIYGFFVADDTLPDSSPKTYYSHYRSDSSFQNETHLHRLEEVRNWFCGAPKN